MKFLERALDGQNQFGKYLIVVLGGFFGGQIIGSIPLVIAIMVKVIHSSGGVIHPENMMDLASFGFSKNLTLFLMMLPFLVSLFFTIGLIKLLHKRTFAESVNGARKLRINRIGFGALVWTLLMAVYLIIDASIAPGNYLWQFDGRKFIILIFISLSLIPLQTTFEELMFRGYLAQGIGARTKNRWLAILIPTLLFGLIHITNPEVKEYGFWLSMPQYFFFGLLFGLISVLDDGIELAIGIHAANNIFLSLFTTHSASVLQTDALFEIQTIDPLKELIVLVVSGLIVLAYFAYKYKWNFGVLKQKIEIQPINN
ncbi:MAG: CPBP family intramembrane metalloprotease [Dysgonamonadaceae bacterium]|jgi:membrane protease YdiL (CAAX protease family)|nr:CPBP family intramembrane metalloprotease [Dysgonamonadaceae bacterium]